MVFFEIGVNERGLPRHRLLVPISIQGIEVFVLNDGLYLGGCISAGVRGWDEKRRPRDEDALFVFNCLRIFLLIFSAAIDVQHEMAYLMMISRRS